MEGVRLSEAGILAIETYFPRQCVRQADLEKFDGVSSGKYTVGLGQDEMAFVDDREDIVSICTTVVRRLVAKQGLDLGSIGRLEVGTETIIDKSKSVKTALMDLFCQAGNTDVEGVDSTNACYGGTAAVFNTLSWMESPWWDGRYGLVVCGDIAVYERGPARPTGGAGAVAILFGINPQPPIRFEINARATHMEHTYDFFKPRLGCEYPTVNGAETLSCYLRALDRCYQRLKKRTGSTGSVSDLADYAVFHAPFNKMVRKSFARLRYNDYLTDSASVVDPQGKLSRFRDVPLADSYTNKELEKAFVNESSDLYKKMVEPGDWLAKRIGNAYTASLWSSLAAILEEKGDELVGKRILMFSYGSGLASSMFIVRVASPIGKLSSSLLIKDRLDARRIVDPEHFTDVLERKEKKYCAFSVEPAQELAELWPQTTCLERIDDIGRRFYTST